MYETVEDKKGGLTKAVPKFEEGVFVEVDGASNGIIFGDTETK